MTKDLIVVNGVAANIAHMRCEVRLSGTEASMNRMAFFDVRARSRDVLIAALLVFVTMVCSCSQEHFEGDLEQPSRAVNSTNASVPEDLPLPDHEPVPHSILVVRWRDTAAMTGAVRSAADGIVGELRNATKKPVTARVLVVTAGLDGRKIERELQRFTLAAEAIAEANVQLSKLPIQSEAALSFAALLAEVDGPKGTIRVSSTPVYYRFQKGYTEAVLYNADEVAKLPNGGLMTEDLMDVRGRILEADGSVTDAADALARTAVTNLSLGKGVQGLSGFGRVAVDPTTGRAPPPFAAKLPGAHPTQTLQAPSRVSLMVCTRWHVQYTDAGFGEDHFATSSWSHQRASFAYAYIVDTGWNTYWEGNLDSAGCAWVSLAPGVYAVFQVTDNTRQGGKLFQSYYMAGGTENTSYDYTGFSVGTGTTWVELYPSGNDSAIQAAAVTGQILYQDANTPHGLGLVSDHPYKVVTNIGCPGFPPATDSCYMDTSNGGGPFGTTRIGTTEIDGVPSANWKYMIAHEIGHHVEDSAMGFYNYNYMDNASEPLCACNYDLSWGNTEHCMQSRENIGGAQNEGFAQAFGGRVFNSPSENDAIHVYYKPFAEDDWDDPEWPPSKFDLLDQPRWRQTQCNVAAKGVEMDWMTFFYAVTMEYSSDSVPMSDVFSLYRLACGNGTPVKCSNQTIGWPNLSFWAGDQWADNPDAMNYFWAMGAAHGVAD
jgi:hypothetical protein